MSTLKIFDVSNSSNPILTAESHHEIATELEKVGIRFEQWSTDATLTDTTNTEAILEAYSDSIEKLKQEEGYITVDAVSMSPDHPDKAAFREKFLNEHIHSEDEVRFFVAGEGLFSLHIEDKIYEVLCVQNDLISVPANTKHWFDMGPNPSFTAIRLFNHPEGWVANFTGSDIAQQFSRLEN